MPAGQAKHDVAVVAPPVPLPNLPGPQSLQNVWPISFWYRPLGHKSQLSVPGEAWNWPRGHSMHDIPPELGKNLPGAQQVALLHWQSLGSVVALFFVCFGFQFLQNAE